MNLIRLKFFLVLLLLPLLILISNFKSAIYACYNGYDLGIYYQAISHISQFGDFNPFVPIRGVNIFNDHFDPVIFFPALLLKIFPHSEITLIFFEWLVVMAGFFILLRLSAKKEHSFLLFWSSIYFLSRGFLTAVTYPIHASTWSLPLWILLAYYILKPNTLKLALVCLSLIFFKESYPITLVLSVPFFFLFKRRQEALTVGIIGIFGILLAFALRPYLFGPVVGYGNVIFHNFFTNPIEFIRSSFFDQNWGTVLKTFIPLIILLTWIIRNQKEIQIRQSIYLILIILWPLFALQFAAQNFQFQYSFPFYAMILTIAFSLGYLPSTKIKKGILVLIFLIPSFKYYEQVVAFVFFDKVRNCSINALRLDDIDHAIEILKNENQDIKIIVTGGVLQRLIPYHRYLYQFGSHGDKLLDYDMAFIERNKSGDVYPINPDMVEVMISQLRNKGVEIMYESNDIIIFKGKILRSELSLN